MLFPGKSPDSLLEDGGGGHSSRGCEGGKEAKEAERGRMGNSQGQPADIDNHKKGLRGVSVGDQQLLDESLTLQYQTTKRNYDMAKKRNQTNINGEGNRAQENCHNQAMSKSSKPRYIQDQERSQQSKSETYRDTSSGQSSMDTYEAQLYEDPKPSISQMSSNQWFSIEPDEQRRSPPIDDNCLKPASVVSKEKEIEGNLGRGEEGAYWYFPQSLIKPSDVLDPPESPTCGSLVTTRDPSFLHRKEAREEDDLEIPAVHFSDFGIQSKPSNEAMTGTLRPKKRKKNVKMESERGKLKESLSKDKKLEDSPGGGNHSRSKTSTLRPKKGRLKTSTAEPGQESSGPKVEATIIVTGNALKEKSNNIFTNSYKDKPLIEDDVSPSKSDILLRQNGSVPDLCDRSLPSGWGEKSESEAGWSDWVENTRAPEDKTNRLKMDLGRRSFSNEDNLNASDLSILRADLTTMSLKGSREEIERVKDSCCDEGSNLPQPTKEWKDKVLAQDLGNKLKPDEAAKVEEVAGDKEGVQTTHSDAKAPDMDTLLSISEVGCRFLSTELLPFFLIFHKVTAVTQWLEEKQGSDLEKVVLVKQYQKTYIRKIFSQSKTKIL